MLDYKHKAVIGLGNPGPRFLLSPHNIGYAVADVLAAERKGEFKSGILPSALVAEVTIGDITLSLIKPTTGMNDSGLALNETLSIIGLDFPEILVVFDDLALPMGKMRFRDSGRQTAGHRGIASLFAFVPEHRLLSRLKLGVGPDPGGENRFAYVTSPLPEDRRAHHDRVVAAAAGAVRHWAVNGLTSAMNNFNSLEIA